jgi:putative ABC transport system permease protein
MDRLALIVHAVVTGPLKQNALRTALAVCAIALGVALGVAVNLINGSAVAEFSRAARVLAGEADLVVRGQAFDEKLYADLAVLPQVEIASPMIELEVKVSGSRDFIKVIGIDPFQSVRVQPAFSEGPRERNLLERDTVVVSDDLAQRFDLAAGRTLTLQTGSQGAPFSVIAILPRESGARNLALIDIATAQWRLHMLGVLNRIDLKLTRGVDAEEFRQGLSLPPGVHAVLPATESEQAGELSRAYRVNLNMLSLVALFTGAFLVFSTQALSILRRRKQLALMRVLGLHGRELTSLVLIEAALIGLIGAALGCGAGILFAQAALRTVGPDLGAGYFRAVAPSLEIEPVALIIFFALGVVAALAGALVPALKVAAIPPAQALKAQSSHETQTKPAILAGMLALATGAVVSFAPAVHGLPLFGYAGIALILLGSCLLTPSLLKRALALAPELRVVPASLALSRLQRSPGETALSIVTILVAFSVMAAMAIMVASFRESLHAWLIEMLPADVYVRARGDSAFLTEAEQRKLAAIDAVKKVAFTRYQELRLNGSAITVIARENPAALPAIGEQLTPRDSPPIWVSQAAADLHGFQLGGTVTLPLAGKDVRFTVAGIWRDYARQTGAAAIDRALYIELTGDTRANDAALWLRSVAEVDVAAEAVRGAIGSEPEVARTSDLHWRSLAAFDRTFAVTYALEAVAVLVGLFGVSASFSARVLDRRGEFGVLRHLGARRRDITNLLAFEGAISGAAGTMLGLLLGACLSVILIFVINRQSFHWSMDLHFPWTVLAGFSLAMIVAATAAAVWSGRHASSGEMLRAVREDW